MNVSVIIVRMGLRMCLPGFCLRPPLPRAPPRALWAAASSPHRGSPPSPISWSSWRLAPDSFQVRLIYSRSTFLISRWFSSCVMFCYQTFVWLNVESLCHILMGKYGIHIFWICHVICMYGCISVYVGHGHRSLPPTLLKIANHSLQVSSSSKAGVSKVRSALCNGAISWGIILWALTCVYGRRRSPLSCSCWVVCRLRVFLQMTVRPWPASWPRSRLPRARGQGRVRSSSSRGMCLGWWLFYCYLCSKRQVVPVIRMMLLQRSFCGRIVRLGRRPVRRYPSTSTWPKCWKPCRPFSRPCNLSQSRSVRRYWRFSCRTQLLSGRMIVGQVGLPSSMSFGPCCSCPWPLRPRRHSKVLHVCKGYW